MNVFHMDVPESPRIVKTVISSPVPTMKTGATLQSTSEENQTSAGSYGQSSGANKPTIGDTTISLHQAKVIQEEVRSTMHKIFPGINLSTARPRSPVMEYGRNESGKPEALIINLAEYVQKSAPMAIAGSDISIASTSSNIGREEMLLLKNLSSHHLYHLSHILHRLLLPLCGSRRNHRVSSAEALRMPIHGCP